MANTIFSGDRVRALRAALQLNTAATIASGAVDPTVSAPGISLSVGSIYLSTSTGKIYQKHTTSGDDTNFYEVQTSDSIAALAADVADLITLSGVPANSTDLGTFTGTSIPDNTTIKGALQALEDEVELRALDSDVIKKDGTVAFTDNQSMGGFSLTNLAAPTNPNDAARKAYVDSEVGAVSTDVADLVSLSGVPANSTNLGTFTGTTIPDSSDIKDALQALETEVELKLDASEKGAANGVATLDAGGKVPVTQLPNSVMEYLGTWAASTNTPTLADGVGNAGDVYIASDAGTVNFGSGNITFAAGDWVIYSGSVWQKSVNSNAVASVNGYTGIVVLDTADISEDPTNLYFTETRVRDTDLAGFVSGPGSVSAADSVLEAIQKLDGNNLATQDDVDDLVTLSGVAVNSVDLGTFTGTTIPDNSDIKEALQALETSVEGKANTTLNNLGSTAVNADILPDASVSRNLGSNSLLWNTVRAYRVATSNTIVSFTGDTTSGSGVISNISNTTNLIVGQSIFGTGIEEGSVIIAINPGVSITIDPAASATNTGVSLKASYSGFFRSEDQTIEPSGIALIRSGNATTGQTGALILRSGNTTTGKTGDVFFRSGVSTSGGTTGNVNIATGTTSGTRGSMQLTANGITIDALGAHIDVNNNKIIDLANPTNAQDAATKAYVDSVTGGGATPELDNLTTTAVNADINPDTDETRNLGSNLLKWNELFARKANLETALIAETNGGTFEVSAGSTEKFTIEFVESTKVANIQHSSSGNLNILATGSGANLNLTSNDENVNIDAGGDVIIDAIGDINFSGKVLTNVAAPILGSDAATKTYADDIGLAESSDLTLTTGDTISASVTSTHQVIVVQGNSAGTTVLSTTPFGTGTPKNGQIITLIGNSSTNLVQIDNNNAAKGCIMNASWVGGQYDSITFAYSGTLDRYVEIARNN